MSSEGRRRTLASVVAVIIGVAFVWTTAEILMTVPEQRLLVLWLLSLVASIASVSMVVFMYMRTGKGKTSVYGADTLVSAVEHSRRVYSVD